MSDLKFRHSDHWLVHWHSPPFILPNKDVD